jgi:FKBP-type peptidyl-prolyl cis-trans isomerase
MKLFSAVLLAALILIACSNKQASNQWMQLDSGVKLLVVNNGSGAPAKKGDKVCIHYIGCLESGEEFENTYSKSKPFTFTLGSGEVIQGLDLGLEGMKPGESRKIIVPAALAYGDRRVSTIPPNSTLVFQVELVEIK